MQTSGPVALWWAYYEYHVLPILPESLRIKMPDWRKMLKFRMPFFSRIVVSMHPALVNMIVGICRLGRRSAEQRQADLEYLIAK